MPFTRISARPLLAIVISVVTTLLCATTLAQNSLYQEQGQLIRAPRALGVLGDKLFGDTVNYYNGTRSFSQTDVSLPGNNALPMAVTRIFNAGNEINERGTQGFKFDLANRMSSATTTQSATGGKPASTTNYIYLNNGLIAEVNQ